MTNGDGDVGTVCADKGFIISLRPDTAEAEAHMYICKQSVWWFFFFLLVKKEENFPPPPPPPPKKKESFSAILAERAWRRANPRCSAVPPQMRPRASCKPPIGFRSASETCACPSVPKVPERHRGGGAALTASRIVRPFYSLWISVKSLSSHTALCSAPLFSTLGGHFSSSSAEEGSQLGGTESVCFLVDMQYLSLALVNIQRPGVPLRPGMLGVTNSALYPNPNIAPACRSSACRSFWLFFSSFTDSVGMVYWIHMKCQEKLLRNDKDGTARAAAGPWRISVKVSAVSAVHWALKGGEKKKER